MARKNEVPETEEKKIMQSKEDEQAETPKKRRTSTRKKKEEANAEVDKSVESDGEPVEEEKSESSDTEQIVNDETSDTVEEKAANNEKAAEDTADNTEEGTNVDEPEDAAADEEKTDVDENDKKEDKPVPKKRGRKKKTEDTADITDGIDFNDADSLFDKRRVHRATNEERKEIYDDEDVFSDFGDVAKTEATKRREEYKMFRDAARSVPKTILKGVIGSVYETTAGIIVASIDESHRLGKKEEDNRAEGYFQVIVPVSQVFPYDERQYKGEEGHLELKRKLQKRIGSEVYFCVYDVQEKEGLVVASCLTAQALRVNKWYIKPDRDGMPQLFEGMLAQATVVEVHNSYLNIDIGGAEGTIRHTELSYNHLSSLYEEYKIGDKFNVKIKGINIYDYEVGKQKYRLARIETSAKEATLSPAEKYFKQFHVGEICAGVIKSEANETGVFVCLKGKMDCLCPIPASKRVTVNAKCGVRITVMDEDTKRIFGEIVSI